MKQYEGDGEGILKTVKNSIKTLTELLETQNEAVGLQVKKGAHKTECKYTASFYGRSSAKCNFKTPCTLSPDFLA